MEHANNGETLYVWGVNLSNKKDKFKVSSHIVQPSTSWLELREQVWALNVEGDGNGYYVADAAGTPVYPSFRELHEMVVDIRIDGYVDQLVRRALIACGWWSAKHD